MWLYGFAALFLAGFILVKLPDVIIALASFSWKYALLILIILGLIRSHGG